MDIGSSGLAATIMSGQSRHHPDTDGQPATASSSLSLSGPARPYSCPKIHRIPRNKTEYGARLSRQIQMFSSLAIRSWWNQSEGPRWFDDGRMKP